MSEIESTDAGEFPSSVWFLFARFFAASGVITTTHDHNNNPPRQVSFAISIPFTSPEALSTFISCSVILKIPKFLNSGVATPVLDRRAAIRPHCSPNVHPQPHEQPHGMVPNPGSSPHLTAGSCHYSAIIFSSGSPQ